MGDKKYNSQFKKNASNRNKLIFGIFTIKNYIVRLESQSLSLCENSQQYINFITMKKFEINFLLKYCSIVKFLHI